MPPWDSVPCFFDPSLPDWSRGSGLVLNVGGWACRRIGSLFQGASPRFSMHSFPRFCSLYFLLHDLNAWNIPEDWVGHCSFLTTTTLKWGFCNVCVTCSNVSYAVVSEIRLEINKIPKGPRYLKTIEYNTHP